jgi:hypothetical protein
MGISRPVAPSSSSPSFNDVPRSLQISASCLQKLELQNYLLSFGLSSLPS